MDILTQALGLILSLAILVLLHEFGHFVFAKMFKTRVEKFYLFFNPWFSLFKFKKGETEYGIGWLPLGGYVKIAGMIDESMDKEQLKQPPQPWEFRSKKTWQRLLIMLGGVLVNFILAMVIYAMVLFVWGREYLPVQNITYGIHADSLAQDIGLRDGDKILKVGDHEITQLSDVVSFVLLEDAKNILVERDGRQETVTIPSNFDQDIIKSGAKTFITFRMPFVIDSVMEGYPAAEAGVIKNDSLIGINDVQTLFYLDFVEELQKHKGGNVDLHLVRNGVENVLKVDVTEEGTIGIGNKPIDYFFKLEKEEYSFFESFPAGIDLGWSTLTGYVKQLKLIFTKEGVKQVGGFGAIGGLFPKTWDWQRFWHTTALLSIILAFMNVLPIPALDGGHVLFLLYEIVTRRKPGDKFMEYAQIVGMVFILGLLLYANGNDIVKLFK